MYGLAMMLSVRTSIASKTIDKIQGVSTQTCILHFALEGRNMQASFGLKVVWEGWQETLIPDWYNHTILS